MKPLKLNTQAIDKEIEKKTQRVVELSEEAKELNKKKAEKIEHYKAKNKKGYKIRSVIVYTLLIVMTVSTIYNTFLKREKSQVEIAHIVNSYNQETAFADQGVLGFLKQNINTLASNVFTRDTKSDLDYFVFDVNSLYITELYKKTNTIANVYFTLTVETKQRDKRADSEVITGKVDRIAYSLFLPVEFNNQIGYYRPAGELQVLSFKTENSTKLGDSKNPLSLFDTLDKIDSSSDYYRNAKLFVENFLRNVYNNDADYSLEYSGLYKLGFEFLDIEKVDNFILYQKDNLEGYNAEVYFTFRSSQGLLITNKMYLKIVENGDSYKITKLR